MPFLAANSADLLERFLEARGRAQAAESQQKYRREPEIAKNRSTGWRSLVLAGGPADTPHPPQHQAQPRF